MLALLKNVSKGSSSLELVNRKRYPNEKRFWTKKFIGGSQNRKCGFQSRARSKTPIRRIEASGKKTALYRFLSVAAGRQTTSFGDRFTMTGKWRSTSKKCAKVRLLFPLRAVIAKGIIIPTGWRANSAIFSPGINSSVVLMTAQYGIIRRDFSLSVRVRLSRGTNLFAKLIALTRVGGLAGKRLKEEDRSSTALNDELN